MDREELRISGLAHVFPQGPVPYTAIHWNRDFFEKDIPWRKITADDLRTPTEEEILANKKAFDEKMLPIIIAALCELADERGD